MKPPDSMLPPHSVEAEEAVLGAILIHGGLEILDDLTTWFKPEYFFLLQHQYIYEACLRLHNRKEAIDYISIITEIRVIPNQLEEMGGPGRITFLINNTPNHLHYVVYAKVVEEAWRRRETVNLSSKLATEALQAETHEESLRLANDLLKLLNSRNDSGEKEKPRKRTLQELRNLPKVKWLIDGELPDRGLTVLCGKSGIGKTFITTDYAHRIASQGKKVMYVALEGQYGIAARFDALTKQRRVDKALIDENVQFWTDSLPLLNTTKLTAFLTEIQQDKPALVIIDTLSLAMSGSDPNSPQAMQSFTDACRSIERVIEGTVLIVHHSRKSDNTFSGAGNLFNNSDTFLNVIDLDGLIAVETDKMKDSEKATPRYYRLMPVILDNGDSVPVLMPASLIQQTQRDNLAPNQRKILEALRDVFENGAMSGDLGEVTGIGRGSLLRTTATLRKLGYIDQAKKFGLYTITQLGKDKLGQRGFLQTDSHDSHDSSSFSGGESPTVDTIPQKTDGVTPDSYKNRILNSSSSERGGESASHLSQTAQKSQPTKPIFGVPAPDRDCHICKTRNWVFTHNTWKCHTCESARAKDIFSQFDKH